VDAHVSDVWMERRLIDMRSWRWLQRSGILLWLLALLLVIGAQAQAPSPMTGSEPILVIQVDGVINPMTAQYVQRALDVANTEGAQLLVIELDTPGGLETSMREIVQDILTSPIPVAVYVSPRGARATSAGMFITLAAHVAAMAPATHIGAAHPVPLGGQIDETMAEKMASDAAALVRGIAAERGRNVEWAEQAVRDSVSLTAEEAIKEQVIDMVVGDLPGLLAIIDGQQVTTAAGDVVLRTAQAPLEQVNMTFIERLMHVISDPNIAYLLLSAGTLFLLAELSDPGLGIGAIGSAVCFILAFLALGSLPVNWAGLALIAVGVVLFIVALFTDTEAIVSVVALLPFILGSLLLFTPFVPRSPATPDLRVNPWLIAGAALGMAAFTLIVLRAVLTAARMPPRSGAQRLVGMQGVAVTDIAPTGTVRVDRQDWSAITADDGIPMGQTVRVVAVTGVRLEVAPLDLPQDPEVW
jgi:membrane-bound serine protease (ClpP class)